jgi:hypothetical protein
MSTVPQAARMPKRNVPVFADRAARELAIMRQIEKGLNHQAGARSISHGLGYRPSLRGVWPVSSSLRSMEKRQLVGRLPPVDQWDHADYFLMPDGWAKLKESTNGKE